MALMAAVTACIATVVALAAAAAARSALSFEAVATPLFDVGAGRINSGTSLDTDIQLPFAVLK
jgi:hypothetical protein